MRKPTKPRTRPATWVERMAFKSKISKAIDTALQNRIAKMTTIPFESPMLDEMFNTPDYRGVGGDVADDLGVAREDHARRMQFMETVKQRLAGNPMSSMSPAWIRPRRALLQDAGYGDDFCPGMGLSRP